MPHRLQFSQRYRSGSAWSRLGLIDAGLGRKENAIRQGRRACELLPITKGVVDGPSCITSLAMIYTPTGEKDLALEPLAAAAQIPGGVTYGKLKLYPQWDSLHGDPRFDKIAASLAPKPLSKNLNRRVLTNTPTLSHPLATTR